MEDYYNRKMQRKQRLQTVKKVCFRIIYIFLIIMIIITLVNAIQMRIYPDKNPNIFGMKAFCIISGSMRPEINVNDVIIVKTVTQGEIEVGDIISFKIEDEIITHRVTKIEQNEVGELIYITKGDANNTEDDEKIKIGDVEGKYIFKIEKIGYFITLLQSEGMLTFILVILVMLYLMEYKANEKRKKRSDERAEYETKNKPN